MVMKVKLSENGPNPCSVLAAILIRTGSFAVRPVHTQTQSSTQINVCVCVL